MALTSDHRTAHDPRRDSIQNRKDARIAIYLQILPRDLY